MPYEICITVYDAKDNLQCASHGEISSLPTPEHLGKIALLVMADGEYAVATVHETNELSVIYGIIVMDDTTLQGGCHHG